MSMLQNGSSSASSSPTSSIDLAALDAAPPVAELRPRGGKWSRDPVPVGTVVIRCRSRRGLHGKPCRVRMIKIRMDGPTARRWVRLARYWWEKNRGPVPDAKRVAHLNGDSLDDRPENYGLVSPGDIAFICHDADPAMSRRNYIKCAKAASAFNRERSATRRAAAILPSFWYPVDFADRSYLVQPFRKRWRLLDAHGVRDCRHKNGAACVGPSLGFPLLGELPAMLLAALADAGGWLDGDQLRDRVAILRSQWGKPALIHEQSFYSAASSLRDNVLVHRRGTLTSRYHISPTALRSRQSACRYVPVRGRELGGEAFAGFTRVLTALTAGGPN